MKESSEEFVNSDHYFEKSTYSESRFEMICEGSGTLVIPLTKYTQEHINVLECHIFVIVNVRNRISLNSVT